MIADLNTFNIQYLEARLFMFFLQKIIVNDMKWMRVVNLRNTKTKKFGFGWD